MKFSEKPVSGNNPPITYTVQVMTNTPKIPNFWYVDRSSSHNKRHVVTVEISPFD